MSPEGFDLPGTHILQLFRYVCGHLFRPIHRAEGGMAKITFEQVSKVFDRGVAVVNDLSLSIDDGEFLVLVGPSGCGKTTSLRMLAGLEELSSGTIRIGDRVVNDIPTKRRDIAMVFQNYSLYPHMTVKKNIGFSLKVRRTPADVVETQVGRAADTLGLTEYLERLPKQLSGGQRQRVAMGRTIVRQPQAFLMDEPLSNLDAKLRLQMRSEISRLQRSLGITTVYVTHDQTEAMTMSDRVAVMNKGVLQQVADPSTIYSKPMNLFIAAFIGSPSMNLVEARFTIDARQGIFQFGSHMLQVPWAYLESRPRLLAADRTTIALGIRPESIHDAAFGTEASALLRAPVELLEYLGSDTLLHMAIDAPRVSTEETKELSADLGELEPMGKADTTTFIARCDPRTRIRPGEIGAFAVEIDRMHFFDLTTGRAL